MAKIYPHRFRVVPCPNLKHLLKYEPKEINKAFHCCGGTRLHHLLRKGLGEETLKLINEGADVNLIDKDGRTVLMVAVTKTSVSSDIVKMIAVNTSDLNVMDRGGNNALHFAVSSANSAAIKIILQLGANIDIQNYAGNAALHCAFNYNLDLVETLLENGANVKVKNNNDETPLHTAVGAYTIGHMDIAQLTNIIRILLDKGADVNEQTMDGKTILHILGRFWKKTPDISELHTFLLNKGAQVHLQDREGVTPLYLAIKEKAEYLGLMLITESGKSAVNIPDNQRNYPLFLAIKRRDFELVKLLLDNGALIDIKNESDQTSLHLALEDGKMSEPIFNLLIDRGAQVSCKDKYMRTPLHIASERAFGQHKLICTTLLSKGASPNVQDAIGKTPLHYAVESTRKDIVHILVENGAEVNIKSKKGETPLHIYTRHSRGTNSTMQDEICLILLDKGALLNAQDDDGMTPLHNAVTCYNTGLVQILLENGAEVNSKNKNEETPLHISTRESRYSSGLQDLICKALLVKGALSNAPDIYGNTPLHNAVKNYTTNIIQLLLENGAEVNSKNKNEETPLHILTHKSRDLSGLQDLICKTLLGRGALPNAQDIYGKTPLHNAAKYCTPNIIQLLLENGAEVNSKNNKGETPLHVSSHQYHDLPLQEQTCSILLAKGASVNVQDDFGMTPLHNAVKNYTTILQLFLENGAELNIKNKKGESPIRYVRTVHDLEVLLQKGADVNDQDNYGQTVLHNIAKNYQRGLTERNLSNHFIIKLYATSKVVKLLEWGASQNIKDNVGKLPTDYYSFTDAQKEYDIKRNCLSSTYKMESDLSDSDKFQYLHKRCCEEINKMKLELLGKNSLYDIFRHYDDPNFLSNGELESAVLSKDLKVKFPVYCSMLTTTYHRSRVRVQLFHHVLDILQTPLPFEVMRYILTFVDDGSLRNVIKAKEESTIKGESDSTSKSASELDLELNSENESDGGYASYWEFDSDPEYDTY